MQDLPINNFTDVCKTERQNIEVLQMYKYNDPFLWRFFSVCCHHLSLYRVIQNDCRGFNNLSYTIHLRWQYVVAPMDQEIVNVFFYDVRCAVVIHFSAWSAVY